jgi:hypothetical protein
MLLDETHLLRLVEAYCAATKRSEARIATLIHNQGAFFDHIRRGRHCTVPTFNKAIRWFDENWPENALWPEDVPRPKKDAA